MEYKATLRIPTSEQYAYIEVQVEDTPEAIVSAYCEFTAMVKPQVGISTKDFNSSLDQYLKDGTGRTEVFHAMSPTQKEVFQCIKRSLTRLEKNNG